MLDIPDPVEDIGIGIPIPKPFPEYAESMPSASWRPPKLPNKNAPPVIRFAGTALPRIERGL